MKLYEHLRFLSLRLLDSPTNNKGYRMQRNLQTNVHYYFYSGIEINEEECLKHSYQSHTLRHYTGALTDIRPAKTEFYF